MTISKGALTAPFFDPHSPQTASTFLWKYTSPIAGIGQPDLVICLGAMVGMMSGIFGVGGGFFDDTHFVFHWHPACRRGFY